MMGGALALHPGNLFPEKIQRQHRERSAIVYIRQSTVQQVERHQESTRLQYALVERAFQFGWARETIIVIDDDLGRSGATIEGRLGFQRLVAEVGLGNVGLVLGVEMSRLARSCRDWHQLLEICALFDTLIADMRMVCMMRPIITTACCSGSRGRCRKRNCTFSRRVCWQADGQKPNEASWVSRFLWATCDGLRVMSRSIPMNRRKRQYGWCSICSNSSGPLARS